MSDNTHRHVQLGTRIERELLHQGNQPLDSWRIFRIMAEFVSGFELLQRYGKAATVFGSARCNSGDGIYDGARTLGTCLAERDYALITGGGGGVMSAANQGAYEAGGRSVGINIQLPAEQELNAYVHDSENFHYFFTRKVMLSFASELYVFFPGGFGTLDEFFEMVTLIQTEKIKPVPIVLIGKAFWEPITQQLIQEQLCDQYGTISQEDTELYTLVDSVDECIEYIDSLHIQDER